MAASAVLICEFKLSFQMEILSGCHVLVSTPPALVKVLEFWPGKKVMDFKRLRALVLDDADVLLGKHCQVVNCSPICFSH